MITRSDKLMSIVLLVIDIIVCIWLCIQLFNPEIPTDAKHKIVAVLAVFATMGLLLYNLIKHKTI